MDEIKCQCGKILAVLEQKVEFEYTIDFKCPYCRHKVYNANISGNKHDDGKTVKERLMDYFKQQDK